MNEGCVLMIFFSTFALFPERCNNNAFVINGFVSRAKTLRLKICTENPPTLYGTLKKRIPAVTGEMVNRKKSLPLATPTLPPFSITPK